MNYPLVDGNKRTGYLRMEALFRYQYKKIITKNSGIYNFVNSIALGEIKFDQIVEWLKANVEDSEEEPLITSNQISAHSFEMDKTIELGQMCQLFFGRIGQLLFYGVITVYLYGELAIYVTVIFGFLGL